MRVFAKLFLVTVFVAGFTALAVEAEVVPGDVIDKTNYQKIEGLVPDFITLWVKNGDMTMKIGELGFDPKTYWSKDVMDNWQSNIGKYKIDENNGMIDVKTGEHARGIKGLPFPEPDMNDPKGPVMLMYNHIFEEYFLDGDVRSNQMWISCTRSGFEKRLVMDNNSMILDHTKSEQDYGQISVFREPFNMSGTGTLALYALYPLTNGIRFAWAPELRKVRRMSHRLTGSDVHFGFDASPDDTWAGGPKTSFEEATYKYLGERDALVPYYEETPKKVNWTEKGSIKIGYSTTGFEVKAGYETSGWTGNPWHITNCIWVKSKVYVVESKSTVRTYAYGPNEGWIEKGTFKHVYKRMTDPNGRLWKGAYWVIDAIETPDGKYRSTYGRRGGVCSDITRNHGELYPAEARKGGFREIMVQDMNEKLFTRAGFIKFSK